MFSDVHLTIIKIQILLQKSLIDIFILNLKEVNKDIFTDQLLMSYVQQSRSLSVVSSNIAGIIKRK